MSRETSSICCRTVPAEVVGFVALQLFVCVSSIVSSLVIWRHCVRVVAIICEREPSHEQDTTISSSIVPANSVEMAVRNASVTKEPVTSVLKGGDVPLNTSGKEWDPDEEVLAALGSVSNTHRAVEVPYFPLR